jgi:hypothetical protein
MSTEKRGCLILRDEVTRDHFQDVVRRMGFSLFTTLPSEGERIGPEEVWVAPTPTAATEVINYVEDPRTELRYLVLRSGTDVDRLSTQLAKHLAVFSQEEILSGALTANTHNGHIKNIARVAVGFVEYSLPAYLILATFARKAEHPLLRECAVNAMGLQAWPQFQPVLEAIVADDPEECVRRHAAAILDVVRAKAADST